MKRILITLISAAMVTAIAAGSTLGFSAKENKNGNSVGYVDADNDGICDNRSSGKGFIDADNDGICDNRNSGKGFVDADNDGICDNRNSGK
ncbi:MAG: hypothetical protein ACI4HK_01940, partial [Ruminococcus sp.]